VDSINIESQELQNNSKKTEALVLLGWLNFATTENPTDIQTRDFHIRGSREGGKVGSSPCEINYGGVSLARPKDFCSCGGEHQDTLIEQSYVNPCCVV